MASLAVQNSKLLPWKTVVPLQILTSFRFFTDVIQLKTKSKFIPTNIFNRGNKDIQLQLHRFLAYHSSPVRKAESSNHIEKAKGTNEFNKHETFSSIESLWESVFCTPHKWYDYRLKKNNQRAPDFRHIETGERLWIESSETPAWALSKLRCLGREVFTPFQSVDDPWKILFADPSKWVDNRNIKKHKKHPDFVHKENHNALWIDEKTPAWVTPMLDSLQDEEFTTSLSMEDLWKKFFADPSKWFDYRKVKRNKKHPDFKHRDTWEALWINDKRTPAWITPLLKSLQDDVLSTSPSMEDLWKSFFADPSMWIDYRNTKKNNKHPDFKHKDTNDALWINDERTPAWITHLLNQINEKAFETSTSQEALWVTLFADPSKWIDSRKVKESNKYPDFVHRYTKKALWIDNTNRPAWVRQMLENLQDEAFATSLSIDHLWKTFFDDPSKWFDNRKIKKSRSYPDFRHKDTREALWIDCKRNPSWVTPMLINLPDEAFALSPEVLASFEDKWKAFFANPSKWNDNRTSKKTPKAPDFKHVDTDEALWVNKSTPTWIILEVNKLGVDAFANSNAKGSSYKSLYADATNFLEN